MLDLFDDVLHFLGGATVWPFARISVFPEKGSGILWYNLNRSGDVDYFSIHKACPVILGNKWIGNKWIGYNAQWEVNTKNCGLSVFETFQPPLYVYVDTCLKLSSLFY